MIDPSPVFVRLSGFLSVYPDNSHILTNGLGASLTLQTHGASYILASGKRVEVAGSLVVDSDNNAMLIVSNLDIIE